jgi:hypothetical protein
MAVFKTLNSQDILISPLQVNKYFYFEGDTALTSSNVGIDRYLGTNGDFLTNKSLTGQISSSYQVTIYNSIKQLYYSNYISGSFGDVSNAITPDFNPDGTITPPLTSSQTYNTLYYNYNSTTLNPQKTFPTSSIGVLSIPSKLYGDYIKPNSFQYICQSGSYYDDGEGRLKSGSDYIGNIIYEHGLVILTDINTNIILNFVTSSNVTCSFSSSYTIYETQYKCTIGADEFDYSLNPSILTGSEGEIYDFATGSYFAPYVTTVGLYDKSYNLLAVAKLAQPLPTSHTTDTTILINLDK